MKLSNSSLTRSIVFTFTLSLCFFLIPQTSYTLAASLELSPSLKSYQVGDKFNTNIIVDTQGIKSSGVDVKISFDPSIIELQDIKNGKIFNNYLGKNINQDLGTAALSGVASSKNDLFNGRGTFAELQWKSKKEGLAQVIFSYTEGSKNDSNIADFDNQKDSLTRTVNGSYTINISGNKPVEFNSPISNSGKVKGAAVENKKIIQPFNALIILIIIGLTVLSIIFFYLISKKRHDTG